MLAPVTSCCCPIKAASQLALVADEPAAVSVTAIAPVVKAPLAERLCTWVKVV